MLPRTIQHPARLVPLAFLVVILVGTSLLMLPISRAGPGGAPLMTALFTATSAVCVTGLNLLRHVHILVRLRAGRHPDPVPGRRPRHHDGGDAAGAPGHPAIAPQQSARRAGRDPQHRAGRRRRGDEAHPHRDRRRRSGHRRDPDAPPAVRLRGALGRRDLERRVSRRSPPSPMRASPPTPTA